jgi:hypothetical protein
VRIFDSLDPGTMRPTGDRSARRADPCQRIAALTAEAYLEAVDGPASHDRDALRILRSA